jgi:hypothetical protein
LLLGGVRSARAARKEAPVNGKIVVLGLVLLDFLGLTAYVIATHGYLGFFQAAFAHAATTLLFVDLALVLGLALVWMGNDARARGAAFWPWAVATLVLGAAGPLGYLLVRERRALALRRGRVPRPAPAH